MESQPSRPAWIPSRRPVQGHGIAVSQVGPDCLRWVRSIACASPSTLEPPLTEMPGRSQVHEQAAPAAAPNGRRPHGVRFRNEEQAMRAKMVEKDWVEAVIGLGPNLFDNSPMESCIAQPPFPVYPHVYPPATPNRETQHPCGFTADLPDQMHRVAPAGAESRAQGCPAPQPSFLSSAAGQTNSSRACCPASTCRTRSSVWPPNVAFTW